MKSKPRFWSECGFFAFLTVVAMTAVHASDMIISVAVEPMFEQALQVRAKPLEATRFGLRVALQDEKDHVGEATIGVFSSAAEAKRALERYLLRFSMLPANSQSASVGEKGAVWKGNAVFIRDNAFVRLSLRNAIVSERKPVIEIARRIDEAMVSGSSGVLRGDRVIVPVIEDFETSGAAKNHWIARTKPLVNGFA